MSSVRIRSLAPLIQTLTEREPSDGHQFSLGGYHVGYHRARNPRRRPFTGRRPSGFGLSGRNFVLMATKPPALRALSNCRNHGDGTVSFSVDRQDGESFAVSCPIEQLKDIINYFFAVARQVSPAAATEPLSGLHDLAPVPIDYLSAGIGNDPDQTILVARIGGFDLALSVPNTELEGLQRDLARTLLTISASPDRRN
jgi:hypothetical protein